MNYFWYLANTHLNLRSHSKEVELCQHTLTESETRFDPTHAKTLKDGIPEKFLVVWDIKWVPRKPYNKSKGLLLRMGRWNASQKKWRENTKGLATLFDLTSWRVCDYCYRSSPCTVTITTVKSVRMEILTWVSHVSLKVVSCPDLAPYFMLKCSPQQSTQRRYPDSVYINHSKHYQRDWILNTVSKQTQASPEQN